MINANSPTRCLYGNLTPYEISRDYLREQLVSCVPESYDSMLSRSKFRPLRVGELRQLENSIGKHVKEVINDQMRRLYIESDHRALRWGAGGTLSMICSLLSTRQSANRPNGFTFPALTNLIVRDLGAISSLLGLYRLCRPKPDLSKLQERLQKLTAISIRLKSDIRAVVAKKRAAKAKAIWKLRPKPIDATCQSLAVTHVSSFGKLCPSE